MSEVLVLMEGIEKTFPGVHALSQCQFELRSGEVHALVGENGAGKSTLMKVLAGVYSKDAGRILYKGKEVEIHNPRAAQHLVRAAERAGLARVDPVPVHHRGFIPDAVAGVEANPRAR